MELDPVTLSSYPAVMAAWPYRAELDWVAQGPDGRFAAYCLVWYDDRNGVGLIEPVGTDPRYRRRSLSRMVCLAALHALGEAGAAAIVYPRGDGRTRSRGNCTGAWASGLMPALEPT